ncbi:MAG TPA: AAA family ATPase [Burkholderiales bacterium]
MSLHRASAAPPAALAAHAARIAALRPACEAAAGASGSTLIETHISSLIAAGGFVWKFKKPLDLGFLDFRTLEARRRCCEDEVRLNRRTAPDLYLEAVPVTGNDAAPRLDGAGTPIDWAVKMRRFPEDATLDCMVRAGRLGPEVVDALADAVAAFHAAAAVAPPDGRYATPSTVARDALENFEHIERLSEPAGCAEALSRLRAWTARELEARAALMEARRRGGFVRECHGDLHLANVALVDGRPLPFDCIEFNAAFRWIDTMSELAFTVMDFADHGRIDLGQRFLNRVLESSGDYDGLGLLRFYLVFRAMVRAKVALIRARQLSGAQARAALDEVRRHVALAGDFTGAPQPRLVLFCGLSGSGKTTLAGQLLESIGAVRVRSDIERKRLHGLAAAARSGSAVGAGLYRPEATRATHERLEDLARSVIDAGYTVIVDAVFLHAAERARFAAIARALGVPYTLVLCEAPLQVLRERIIARAAVGRDASEATLEVLERQLGMFEAPDAAEADALVRLDTTDPEAILHLAVGLGGTAARHLA